MYCVCTVYVLSTVYVLCIYCVCTVYILCMYCSYTVYEHCTVYVLCIYCVCTVYVLCTMYCYFVCTVAKAAYRYIKAHCKHSTVVILVIAAVDPAGPQVYVCDSHPVQSIFVCVCLVHSFCVTSHFLS